MGDARLLVLLPEMLAAGGFIFWLAWGIIGLWFSRTISAAEGMFLGGLLLGGLVLIIRLIGTPYFFPILLLVAVLAVLVRGLPERADQHSRRELITQDEAVYRVAIRRDPKNAAAHSFLARALEKTGRYQEAVQSYQESVKLEPYGEDRRRLQTLLRTLEDQQAGARRCPRCLGKIASREAVCPHCDHPLSPLAGIQEMMRERSVSSVLGLVGMAGVSFCILALLATASFGLGLLVAGGVWLGGFLAILAAIRRRRANGPGR